MASPSSAKNNPLQRDFDVVSSQDSVSSDLEDYDPFPFLDLPKDVRLVVYDNLLTRTHYQVSLHAYQGKGPRVTIVTSDPIPPIHQACKLLHDEAGPFIKAKLERMSSPWAAPRVIIEPAPGPNDLLLDQGGFVDEMMRYVSGFQEQDMFGFDLFPFPESLPFGKIGSIKDLTALEEFSERAGQFMSSLKVLSMSWTDEAQWRLVDEEDDNWCMLWYDFAPKKREEMDEKLWEKIVDYARFLSRDGVYNGTRGLFQIALVTDDATNKDCDMKMFLDRLANVCKERTIKTSVSTVGWRSDEIDGAGYHEYMRFDGEMHKQTWYQEWS